jgi:hypothetical protein
MARNRTYTLNLEINNEIGTLVIILVHVLSPLSLSLCAIGRHGQAEHFVNIIHTVLQRMALSYHRHILAVV